MTEPITLTKLIILYMLDQMDCALKKTQLADFLLGENYNTSWYNFMQAFGELEESNLVETSSTHSTTFVTLTDLGRDTLHYFHNRISEGIKNDISKYFEANSLSILNEVSVMSNYYRISSGEYVAELSAREKASDLISLKLYMPSEESAKTLCDNWKDKSQEIYAYIVNNLL